MKNEYIVAIDYSANYKPLTIDYKMLKAENLLDAMNEAEQYMDKETVYLLKIMKRSGAAHKVKGVDEGRPYPHITGCGELYRHPARSYPAGSGRSMLEKFQV